jgi:hypothetical protein
MRTAFPLATLFLLVVATGPACAFGAGSKVPDQQSIDALEVKASQAQPREQCYLYAELVQQMTEFSLRQYSEGNVSTASAALKHIQQFTHKIHASVAGSDKRIKNAEILLRHTAFRLNEMLHNGSYEDRPLVEQTLTDVNQAQNETLMMVFRK